MKDLFNKNGYNPETNLYKSRYYAKKQARENELIVKVEGGFKLMKGEEWIIWKKQR